MDARTLALLLAKERPHLVRTAQRRLPSAADAEDVVQRAMTKAVSRAGSLEDPARVHAWFGRILTRSVVDFHRSRGLETLSESGDVEPAATAEPSTNLCPCSLSLLNKLRPAYETVLRRVDVDGEAPEAVARELGISASNLYVRLHRARQALRTRVEAHCGVSSCGPCLDCGCDQGHRCGGSARLPAP